MRKIIPEDVLRQIATPPSGSLFYEAYMLQQTGHRCGEPLTASDDNAARSMALESFLIHFRNLRDFLYPDELVRGCNDNVIAFDYDPCWNKVNTDWTPCSVDEQKRINKLLAHISYSRDGLERGWPVGEMYRGIMRGLRGFVRSLQPDRQKWFERWGDWKG